VPKAFSKNVFHSEMFTKRVIIVAVGQRKITYGASGGPPMPREFLQLMDGSHAASWTLTRGGAVAYFSESRSMKRLLKSFFGRAEALRGAIPNLGIGVAHRLAVGRYNIFGRLKRDYADYAIEQRAIDNVQGTQIYRSILDKLE
jgi:hypothetical protein